MTLRWDRWPGALTFLALLLSQSAGAECRASHPALRAAELPPPIPLETLFANAQERWGYRVSPDGRKLLWLSLKDGKAAIHFRTIGESRIEVIEAERPISWAYWANDSRHVMAWWDEAGEENYHLVAADTLAPHEPARDLTPYPGVRVYFQQYFPDGPPDYLIRHNRRDRSITDLYRINLASGEQTLVARNPGTVESWLTDQAGRPIARKRRLPRSAWILEAAVLGGWRAIARGGPEDSLQLKGHPPAGSRFAWALSNRGRDRVAVVKLSLETGAETVSYEHPSVDVSGLWVDELSYEPLMAWAWPGYMHVQHFESGLEKDLQLFAEDRPFSFEFGSWSRDKRLLTVWISQDKGGKRHYLVDREEGSATLLASSTVSAHAGDLAEMRPISFVARDGLMLHGYLTLPRGTHSRPLPTVLKVHGGPFWRDYWGYDDVDQFLANRGYAVLRVNYRGSTGYGRAFIEAARREFAGKMHGDLIDAVEWLVAEGIADPAHVGIYGKSYGGYAALVGLTFTPEVFAAAVDIVGVADLQTMLETGPPYWKLYLPYWHRFIGDPDNADDRAHMAMRSPINFIDRIKRPLLVAHGANDVRVAREHSDRIVAEMRSKGLDVRYLLFDDEGHSIRKWHNRLELGRATEAFFAEHLGGRACG